MSYQSTEEKLLALLELSCKELVITPAAKNNGKFKVTKWREDGKCFSGQGDTLPEAIDDAVDVCLPFLS